MFGVSSSKINRPKISGILDRERLFRELDQARERPVVWIESPAGSGKTTLVSSYLDARKLKCLWYQVDEGDNDLATFFYYMSLAGQQANRRKKKKLPLLTPEYLAGIPTFAKRFFEDLCSRLSSPYAIVLDNYQEVGDDSPLHDIIRHGLTVLPSGITVFIVSRAAPPPAMAPLRVARSLNLMGWRQLRLQRRELEEFVDLSDLPGLDDDTIRRLHARTDGWIAGLILLLERLKSEGAEIGSFSGRPPGELFEYFAVEIFDRLDKATQSFLLKTAFLPTVTGQLAREIADTQNAEQILSSLHRHHFFTDKRKGSETVYQYHPLFKEFLVDQARKRFSIEEMNIFRQNAARACEESGLIEDAAELFKEAGDWQWLSLLAVKNAPALVGQGRSNTLKAWISALPAENIESEPWLLFWMGQCLLYLNPKGSRTYFEQAFKLFCDRNDASGLYHAWCGIIESIEYGFDSLKPLAEWITVFDGLTRKYGPVPRGEIEFLVATGMVTALVMTMPEHPEMDEWLAKALSFTEQSRNTNITALTLFHCSYYLSTLGQFARAEEMIHSSKQMSARPDSTHFVRIVVELAKALYCQHVGQFEGCTQAVAEGLDLADFSGIHLLDFQLMGTAVMSCLGMGDFQQAKRYIVRMGRSSASVPKWDKAFYYFLLAWKAFLQGDLSKAENHSGMAFRLTFEVGAAPSNFLCNLERALIMHEADNHADASAYLQKAFECSRRFKGDFLEFACRLTDAYFHLRTGQEQTGSVALQAGMAIGRQHGYMNMYMWYPAMMTFLCTMALEQGIEVQYVRELIKYHNLVPGKPPIHLEHWPWSVKINTLGSFSIEIDSNELAFSGKAQKKPLELLQAIIAFGGEGVPDERIAEALWPDADGDLAMQSYRTTISRLRKLLRHENAIVTGAGKIGLDRRLVWTDVWAFAFAREIEKQSTSVNKKGDSGLEKQFERLVSALECYKGEFLPGQDLSWALPMRERLRNSYLAAIMDTGLYLENGGETERAIAFYQKGLAVDNLIEGLYQRLIVCYGKLGRGAEALKAYNNCQSSLAAELGIEPSQQTKEILKRYVGIAK